MNLRDTARGISTLWLPLTWKRETWLAIAAVAAVYVVTMSRDLSHFDSAELAMVAVEGGLGHPLGQPVHTILGWLASHLPGVPPLLGLNLLSALPTALLLLPMASLAESMMRPEEVSEGAGWFRPSRVAPATLGLFALHPVLWENGSRVEVYALAAFLALWATARAAGALSNSTAGPRDWLPAGLGFGLAASTNAYIALVPALALGPAILAAFRSRGLRPRALLGAVAGGLLGLSPYLYVPAVAHREGVFLWGLPRSAAALHWYFSGSDFGHNRQVTWSLVFEHAQEWLVWMASAGALPLILVGLGAHLAWSRRPAGGPALAATAFGLATLLVASNVVFYPEVPDYSGYLAVPFALTSIGVTVLVAKLLAGSSLRKAAGVLLLLGMSANVALSPPALLNRTRHRDDVARRVAEGVLGHAPPDAIIVVGSDHVLFPTLYLQRVEHLRPDVTVLAAGLAGSSWYWPQVHAAHPEVAAIALRAPGGTPARIRRFLRANSDRPVLYESWDLGQRVGDPTCAGAWLVADRNACPVGSVGGTTAGGLVPQLGEALTKIGSGSPPSQAVIARMTLERGEALWRLGRPAEALAAFRAGVPASLLPRATSELEPGSAPPLRGASPAWASPPLIGDPAQNLYLAGILLLAAGARDASLAHLQAAVAAGMPPRQIEDLL